MTLGAACNSIFVVANQEAEVEVHSAEEKLGGTLLVNGLQAQKSMKMLRTKMKMTHKLQLLLDVTRHIRLVSQNAQGTSA